MLLELDKDENLQHFREAVQFMKTCGALISFRVTRNTCSLGVHDKRESCCVFEFLAPYFGTFHVEGEVEQFSVNAAELNNALRYRSTVEVMRILRQGNDIKIHFIYPKHSRTWEHSTCPDEWNHIRLDDIVDDNFNTIVDDDGVLGKTFDTLLMSGNFHTRITIRPYLVGPPTLNDSVPSFNLKIEAPSVHLELPEKEVLKYFHQTTAVTEVASRILVPYLRLTTQKSKHRAVALAFAGGSAPVICSQGLTVNELVNRNSEANLLLKIQFNLPAGLELVHSNEPSFSRRLWCSCVKLQGLAAPRPQGYIEQATFRHTTQTRNAPRFSKDPFIPPGVSLGSQMMRTQSEITILYSQAATIPSTLILTDTEYFSRTQLDTELTQGLDFSDTDDVNNSDTSIFGENDDTRSETGSLLGGPELDHIRAATDLFSDPGPEDPSRFQQSVALNPFSQQ